MAEGLQFHLTLLRCSLRISGIKKTSADSGAKVARKLREVPRVMTHVLRQQDSSGFTVNFLHPKETERLRS